MTYCDRWHDKTTDETEGLKCPYCQYIDTDAWEHFNMDEHGYEVHCQDCGKPFWASRSITITYYGAPAEVNE